MLQVTLAYESIVLYMCEGKVLMDMLCSQCASDKVTVKFTHHQIDAYIRVACECGYVTVDTLKTSRGRKSFSSFDSIACVLYDATLCWV